MMTFPFKIIALTLLFPLAVLGQPSLTPAQLEEDYTLFKDILALGHPSLYAYTSPVEWDSIYDAFEEVTLPTLLHSDALFRSLSGLADHAKDGHLSVIHPTTDTVPNMFPVLLKIIEGKLYTDTDDFSIPLGAEVLAIDGVSSEQLLKQLLKYAPTDGYAITKKYRQVEREFGILHYYEFGSRSSYSVQYRMADRGAEVRNVAAQSFESIGNRFPLRNSHFAAYHGQPDQLAHVRRMREPWPFVTYIDSLSSAILTVNSFGLDPRDFKSRLVELFKELKKNRVKNLIIDVRQNAGGYRVNAITLFSFLTNEPFRQRISESAITDQLPRQEHLIHAMSDYSDFFDMYFGEAKQEDGRWVLTNDHAQAEMLPQKKPFRGAVFVLIGGNTFSAASAFALNAKNAPHITLVGEETGGGYYFHTGQYPAMYELPHSKIRVRMSFVRVDKFVQDTTVPQGSGILPDHKVSLTVKDLMAGTDSQLDYVLNMINRDQ
ncbi:MAG TPA: hypothetical protein DCE41_30920 [Cytophagales bacterium]|nr:hypothetical protein [Cytophagales bacterium]HAP59055.1 hypothetical protein [Cytophagales bacterium]